MFRSAHLKLTAWYLFIIMCIMLFFSATAYQLLTVEIRRGLHMEALRSNGTQPLNPGGSEGISSTRSDNDGDEDSLNNETSHDSPLFELFRTPPPSYEYDVELFDEERGRVLYSLTAINIGILVASGIAAYFLAGRTLKPIEAMMIEQKRFISDASHELRTPLTAMRTEIEVALRDKNLDSEEARNVLESSLEEIDKLQMLSDRLLALGRLQNSKNDVEFEPVNIAGLGEDAIRQVMPLAVKKNMRIEFEPVATGEAIIEARRGSLVELLVIFLDNAIKYSPDDSSVILQMIAHKNHVTVVIQDFGLGIQVHDMPHIFNRFFRADMARTSEGVQGYGLGLSIAKGIIEQHHGKIHIESEPGRGTKFVITLPRKQNPQDDQGKITIRIV